MEWGEAFGRAAGALIAAIIWELVGLGIFLVGVVMIGSGFEQFDTNWGKVVSGAIFTVVGWIVIYLGVLATGIKTITDAVTDHVQARLDPTGGGDLFPSTPEPRRRTPGGARPPGRPSRTPITQATPAASQSMLDTTTYEITISSTGGPVGVAISMSGPWILALSSGGSPYDGPVIVDNHLGFDDQIRYFAWNPDHTFVEPGTFEFAVTGPPAPPQSITVHLVE